MLENELKSEKERSAELGFDVSRLEGKLSLEKKEKDMVELEGKLKEIIESIQF